MPRFLFALMLISDVIILDQVTKWLVRDMETVQLIGNTVSLHYAENTGIAFSLPVTGDILLIFTIIFLGLLIAMYVQLKAWEAPLLNAGLALMIGGAIGNGIDRFMQGYVIDFIKVGSFPIFNVADIAVFFGVVFILWYELAKR